MADKMDLRVFSFQGTGPGTGGAVLLAAQAGRVFKIWKIVCLTGGAVLSNTATGYTNFLSVSPGVMPYDGAPYYVGNPGEAVYWNDAAATSELMTVWYTAEGGV